MGCDRVFDDVGGDSTRFNEGTRNDSGIRDCGQDFVKNGVFYEPGNEHTFGNQRN